MAEKKQLVVLTITGTVERGVTMADLKAFAQDAVETWGGQRHPDDPLFGSMDVTAISAQRIATVGG